MLLFFQNLWLQKKERGRERASIKAKANTRCKKMYIWDRKQAFPFKHQRRS